MANPSELAHRVAAGDASVTEETIVALLRTGDQARARVLLANAGIIPGDVEIDAGSFAAAVKARRLSDVQAIVLLRILVEVDSAVAAELALAIWKWGGDDARRRVAYALPNMLVDAGRTGQTPELFKEIVAAGYLIGDFRPFVWECALGSAARSLAAELHARDKNRADTALAAAENRNPEMQHASSRDAVKGCSSAMTAPGDHIGCDRAVLVGNVTPASPGARYRFEYGDDPGALNRTTDWFPVPPPLTGRWRELLYRQRGEWQPTSVAAAWEQSSDGDPVLAIEAPFARDRNQLNGIGAHDMALGILWTDSPARGDEHRRSACASVGGGELDLRDAVLTFTVAGRDLRQNGAALHFWAGHYAIDAEGPYTSQWALTGSAFPDEALSDAVMRRVRLVLANDPRLWTYTGNNPKEQRARASRYRRASLNTTLSASNCNSVIIFGLGDPLRPPTGALIFSEAEVQFRDYSVLSPAAGAALTDAPSGPCDPRNLTAGWRGYDDRLWASAQSLVFPLVFTWQLYRPTRLTKIQFNQHPYWPARDVEVLIEDESGRIATAWKGGLPEGRADQAAPDHLLVRFGPGLQAAKVTLRILSGYSSERCGLDGIELYGEDAVFTPDGNACSVSAEVSGLAPGARMYYRIVLEDGAAILRGEIAEIELPVSRKPVIESIAPWRRRREPACYVVRGNAMGLETELWGELTTADGATCAGTRISFGTQPTGRHAHYEPRGIPEIPGKFEICARNAEGEARMSAPWPITGEGLA